MPIYCYKKPNGEIIEEVFLAGEAPGEIVLDYGYIAYRDYQAEVMGQTAIVKGTSNRVKRTWPMKPCIASGVHPDQAQELRDHLSERGCPTEVTGGGNPVYTSAAHRRKALKIRGFHDKAAYT